MGSYFAPIIVTWAAGLGRVVGTVDSVDVDDTPTGGVVRRGTVNVNSDGQSAPPFMAARTIVPIASRTSLGSSAHESTSVAKSGSIGVGALYPALEVAGVLL